MENYFREVWRRLPIFLKATAWLAKYVPPYKWFVESITRKKLKKLAYEAEGTMQWVKQNDIGRIDAFYGSKDAYKAIPDWDKQSLSSDPSLDHFQPHTRLDHGYDESKKELELMDLLQAAVFRGGSLVSVEWDGHMHASLAWKCCQGHVFEMTPHAVLKGGHWCMECISPPWDYDVLLDKNSFAAQVLKPSSK